jgi:DNA-binding transcriptional LysR family regulator
MDAPGSPTPAGTWGYCAVDLGTGLREIRCFVLVAQQLSFSSAAQALGISQPAVSQAIGRLERGLGVRLFERTSRDVQLSGAGKVLLPHAEALLERAADFAAEAARLAVPSARGIRLAYCPLVGGLAARVARRLYRRSGPIEVELRPAGWNTAMAELAQGTASAAIMSTPFPRGLATTARFHVPITHLAVPAANPLASASRLRLSDLHHDEVLMPRGRPPGSLWAHLSTVLRGTHQTEGILDDFDDLPAALDLVAAGRGLLPVPRLLVETISRPDVRFVPLEGSTVRMTYALVWSQDGASAELMALVQVVQEILRMPGQGAR